MKKNWKFNIFHLQNFKNGGQYNNFDKILFNSHYQRACDTLRVIIKEFLPVIQSNIDPWRLGADIAREERAQKCVECRGWLLKIRCLPENEKIGSSLLPLQKMIVDI